MAKRIRRVGSVKNELLQKSRESMLAAVQIFNNPNITFKSESFIVLAVIAWTYLLHSYYRGKNIEYRYFKVNGNRRKFDKTKNGADKYWELERCLDEEQSPIDHVTAANLKFLIGLRHEIEHQMTTRIDDVLSARFQACCLNYNQYLKTLFSNQEGIEQYLSFSLQFSSISEEQVDSLSDYEDLPKNISAYINEFDHSLSDEDFNDSRFSYRVLFVPKTANRKGQADKVVEFIPADSDIAKGMNKQYVLVKEKEKPKYRATDVINQMQALGFTEFNMHAHTKLWKNNNGKNPVKGFGTEVANYWYWYQTWIDFVKKHCQKKYKD